jgi:hypothetical protein
MAGWAGSIGSTWSPKPARRVHAYASEGKRALPLYWRVTGVAAGSRLSVHDAPSASATVVHALASHATCIKLAGGCRKPWCRVRVPSPAGEQTGWVDSKHLAPSDAHCTGQR